MRHDLVLKNINTSLNRINVAIQILNKANEEDRLSTEDQNTTVTGTLDATGKLNLTLALSSVQSLELLCYQLGELIGFKLRENED